MKAAWTLGLAIIATTAFATDHDNIDAGRPLSFDDAETIAYREMAFEMGFAVDFMNRRGWNGHANPAFLYGIARDTQIGIGVGAAFGSGARSSIEASVLHSLRREIRNSPALAVKLEAHIPTSRGEATEFKVRGIASKSVGQYGRLHLNLDVDFLSGARSRTRLGAILGYSHPVGYPTSFDTTAVAELAIKQGERRGQGATLSAGIGLRRQITPRSVFDIGIQSEILSGRSAAGTPFRLVAGYSTSF